MRNLYIIVKLNIYYSTWIIIYIYIMLPGLIIYIYICSYSDYSLGFAEHDSWHVSMGNPLEMRNL